MSVATGCGFSRRYIDFLILLIPPPLVSVLFCSASLLFVHKKNTFSFLLYRRKKKKNANSIFFTSRCAYVKCAIIVMLYTHWIRNQL